MLLPIELFLQENTKKYRMRGHVRRVPSTRHREELGQTSQISGADRHFLEHDAPSSPCIFPPTTDEIPRISGPIDFLPHKIPLETELPSKSVNGPTIIPPLPSPFENSPIMSPVDKRLAEWNDPSFPPPISTRNHWRPI